jgi:hypothetical protein
MGIFALILWVTLGGGAAAAFECTGVKLPSTIVICSDPELMRLADERQEAINEARGRIGEDAWPVLWENQKAWVKSYATACGVPIAGTSPTTPKTWQQLFDSLYVSPTDTRKQAADTLFGQQVAAAQPRTWR